MDSSQLHKPGKIIKRNGEMTTLEDLSVLEKLREDEE